MKLSFLLGKSPFLIGKSLHEVPPTFPAGEHHIQNHLTGRAGPSIKRFVALGIP